MVSVRPVLAVALVAVVGRSIVHSRVHLPTLLRSTSVKTLLRSYEGSDSRHSLQRAAGYPRLHTHELLLSFCLQPPVVSPCPLSSAHSSFAFWACLWSAVSRLRASDSLGFATSPAGSPTTTGRIEFLSYGPTDSPLRCSPPRLTTTQLRAAFNLIELSVERDHTSFSCVLFGRTGADVLVRSDESTRDAVNADAAEGF